MEALQLPPRWRLVALETVGSTNDEARRLAEAGAAEGTLVWARAQTAGRGRLGRPWASPPGNLYASLILRPPIPPGAAATLSFVAAVAVADALAEVAPPALPIALKWPNDVLLDGRKVAGILLETQTTPGTTPDAALAFVVLGFGVNVMSHPADARYPATDLARARVGTSVETLLGMVCRHLSSWAERWRVDGFAPVRAAWLARAQGRGLPIDVRVGNTLISGSFCDLDGDGAMIIETTPGERRRITAGDVGAPGAAPTAVQA
jgi:BirA family biotin operon repressor/biotin-[acetyl-CoA-carboxylase] ligase